MPDQPLGFLIAGGLLFSMVNTAVEEGAYRGVILHALETSLGPGFAALLLQAAAFGALHIEGFHGDGSGLASPASTACSWASFAGVPEACSPRGSLTSSTDRDCRDRYRARAAEHRAAPGGRGAPVS